MFIIIMNICQERVKMRLLKSIYGFYLEGFKKMVIGKTLWKIVFVKIALILLVLNYFVYDRSINTEYKSEKQKSDFVYKNLVKE